MTPKHQPQIISARQNPPFRIIPLGDDMPYDFKRPHRHDYFEFFVFFRSGGDHHIDFTTYPILERSVHIVFPGQIHLLRRKGAVGLIFVCRPEFMNSLGKIFYTQLYQERYTNPCITFSPEAFEGLLSLCARLQEEEKSNALFAPELIRSYMSVFISTCIREGTTEKDLNSTEGRHHPSDLDLYSRFKLLLENNYTEKQSVDFYAQELAVSARTLSNTLKMLTGKTCVQLLQDRTLLEAKRLLLYTDKSCKEIAFELNFKDTSYFTRFFTRLEGSTPSAFKASWEEKYHS